MPIDIVILILIASSHATAVRHWHTSWTMLGSNINIYENYKRKLNTNRRVVLVDNELHVGYFCLNSRLRGNLTSTDGRMSAEGPGNRKWVWPCRFTAAPSLNSAVFAVSARGRDRGLLSALPRPSTDLSHVEANCCQGCRNRNGHFIIKRALFL